MNRGKKKLWKISWVHVVWSVFQDVRAVSDVLLLWLHGCVQHCPWNHVWWVQHPQSWNINDTKLVLTDKDVRLFQIASVLTSCSSIITPFFSPSLHVFHSSYTRANLWPWWIPPELFIAEKPLPPATVVTCYPLYQHTLFLEPRHRSVDVMEWIWQHSRGAWAHFAKWDVDEQVQLGVLSKTFVPL